MGGYCINIAISLFNMNISSIFSNLLHSHEFEVDIAGFASILTSEELILHLDWGFNRSYKNEVEIWGEKGNLYLDRVFSKPEDLSTEIIIKYQDGQTEKIKIKEDNHFTNMFNYLLNNYNDKLEQKRWIKNILNQAKIIQDIAKS